MDTDRDPTDLGLSAIVDPDEGPVDFAELVAPERGEVLSRGEAWESIAEQTGRRSNRSSLGSECQCGASSGTWCRRAGRAVVGFVHPTR